MRSHHKNIIAPKKWATSGIEYRCKKDLGPFHELDPVWRVTHVHFQIIHKIDWEVMREITWYSEKWYARLIGWIRSLFV